MAFTDAKEQDISPDKWLLEIMIPLNFSKCILFGKCPVNKLPDKSIDVNTGNEGDNQLSWPEKKFAVIIISVNIVSCCNVRGIVPVNRLYSNSMACIAVRFPYDGGNGPLKKL